MNTRTLLAVLLLAVAAWLLGDRCSRREKPPVMDALPEVERGIGWVRTEVVETERRSAFLALRSRDSAIAALQREVKRYGNRLGKRGSAATVAMETVLDTTLHAARDGSGAVASRADLGPWGSIAVTTAGDSTRLFLRLGHALTVATGERRKGLFRRPSPFAEATSKGPYAVPVSIAAYRPAAPKPSRLSLGPVAAIGISTTGGIRPFLGIGIQYRF